MLTGLLFRLLRCVVLACGASFIGVLLHQCLGFAPERHEALLGDLSSMSCLLRYLVFFVSLFEKGASPVECLISHFFGVLRGRSLLKVDVLRLSAQLTSVVVGGG